MIPGFKELHRNVFLLSRSEVLFVKKLFDMTNLYGDIHLGKHDDFRSFALVPPRDSSEGLICVEYNTLVNFPRKDSKRILNIVDSGSRLRSKFPSRSSRVSVFEEQGFFVRSRNNPHCASSASVFTDAQSVEERVRLGVELFSELLALVKGAQVYRAEQEEQVEQEERVEANHRPYGEEGALCGRKVFGLENSGNTCFANALVQAWYNLRKVQKCHGDQAAHPPSSASSLEKVLWDQVEALSPTIGVTLQEYFFPRHEQQDVVELFHSLCSVPGSKVCGCFFF